MEEGERLPLFTFGACSDLQYADIDNRVSFHGNTRYYRNSLLALKEVIALSLLFMLNANPFRSDLLGRNDVEQRGGLLCHALG